MIEYFLQVPCKYYTTVKIIVCNFQNILGQFFHVDTVFFTAKKINEWSMCNKMK